jgi:hypothetical protein
MITTAALSLPVNTRYSGLYSECHYSFGGLVTGEKKEATEGCFDILERPDIVAPFAGRQIIDLAENWKPAYRLPGTIIYNNSY